MNFYHHGILIVAVLHISAQVPYQKQSVYSLGYNRKNILLHHGAIQE